MTCRIQIFENIFVFSLPRSNKLYGDFQDFQYLSFQVTPKRKWLKLKSRDRAGQFKLPPGSEIERHDNIS